MPAARAVSTSTPATSSACARDSIWHGPAISTNGRSLPSVTSPTRIWRGSDKARLPHRRTHETREQRVRRERFRFQFGMELHADEPRMLRIFDDLRQNAVGRQAGEAQPSRFQPLTIMDVHLVAMPMPLGNL